MNIFEEKLQISDLLNRQRGLKGPIRNPTLRRGENPKLLKQRILSAQRSSKRLGDPRDILLGNLKGGGPPKVKVRKRKGTKVVDRKNFVGKQFASEQKISKIYREGQRRPEGEDLVIGATERSKRESSQTAERRIAAQQNFDNARAQQLDQFRADENVESRRLSDIAQIERGNQFELQGQKFQLEAQKLIDENLFRQQSVDLRRAAQDDTANWRREKSGYEQDKLRKLEEGNAQAAAEIGRVEARRREDRLFQEANQARLEGQLERTRSEAESRYEDKIRRQSSFSGAASVRTASGGSAPFQRSPPVSDVVEPAEGLGGLIPKRPPPTPSPRTGLKGAKDSVLSVARTTSRKISGGLDSVPSGGASGREVGTPTRRLRLESVSETEGRPEPPARPPPNPALESESVRARSVRSEAESEPESQP
tara:strand:+ start:3111 stop:4379 length:1269 start_codon:yes stop_codon:yes gene_type:complete